VRLAQLEIRLLGVGDLKAFQEGSNPLAPSCRNLLAYLLLRHDRNHARDVVATAFWGESPESVARRRLNTTLWRLRKVLEPEGVPRGTFIVTPASGEVGFNRASDYWLDVDEFALSAAPLVSGGDELTSDEIHQLERAVGLYQGDLLEGVYDDWVLEERARLANLYLASLARLAHGWRARGDLMRSLFFGELLLEREPLREDVHREMMSTYAAAGRRAEALRQYDRCRETLRRELDIEPMPETVHLAARLAAGKPPAPSGVPIDVSDVLVELERARRETTRLAESIDYSLELLRAQFDR
jgi:DNA-binding SARP family transcriptional activator